MVATGRDAADVDRDVDDLPATLRHHLCEARRLPIAACSSYPIGLIVGGLRRVDLQQGSDLSDHAPSFAPAGDRGRRITSMLRASYPYALDALGRLASATTPLSAYANRLPDRCDSCDSCDS
jgi:hypothetical protein